MASNAEHVTHGLFLSVGLIRFAAIRYVTIHEVLSAVAMSESRNLNAFPTDNNGAWGLSGVDEYRGLRPGSKLVMTHKGQAFELAFKHRQLHSGPEVYRACDALQQTISRLYRQAGIKQGSSHSGRRSLAAKVLAVTGDVETVQMILGHSCLDHSKPYLSVDQGLIRRAFEVAL